MAAPGLIDGPGDTLQPGLQVNGIGGETADREPGSLMQALVVDLGDQDLVPVSDSLDEAACQTALLLQASGLGQMKLEMGNTHEDVALEDVFLKALALKALALKTLALKTLALGTLALEDVSPGAVVVLPIHGTLHTLAARLQLPVLARYR